MKGEKNMFKNRKGMIERKNDLITRAEEIVNTADAEKRELTEDEAMELAEIRDDVKKIKEKLMMMDEIDAGREKERKPAEPKPEKKAKPAKRYEDLSAMKKRSKTTFAALYQTQGLAIL